MGRKKKKDSEEILTGDTHDSDLESTEINDEKTEELALSEDLGVNLEAEQVEAEASEDFDPTVNSTEREEVVEVSEEPKPKSRRKRSTPKAKRAPRRSHSKNQNAKANENEDVLTIESDAETGTDGALHLREDVAIASIAMQKSMDNMAHQWGAIKLVSEQISSNFEKMVGSLKDLHVTYNNTLDHQEKRSSGIGTKLAVGVSALSILISVVTFSFSHSLRQKFFKSDLAKAAVEAANVAAKHVTPVPLMPLPTVLESQATSSAPKEVAAVPRPSSRLNILPSLGESSGKGIPPRRNRNRRAKSFWNN